MAKKIKTSTRISKELKVEDWSKFRENLIDDILFDKNEPELWEKAYAFFFDRIESRFLNPIKWILDKEEHQGEGFSVMALMCILLEFLEATYEGKLYTVSDDPQPYEYTSSRKLFLNILTSQAPFSHYFYTKKSSDGFYNNIRCGLLHEASTKETSVIRKKADGDQMVEFVDNDKSNFKVYRENFYEAMKTFIDNYKAELFSKRDLKINFVRRFDGLCGINRTYYFAYGSNMDKAWLTRRIKKFHAATRATLKDYQFVYNKKSKDGSSKANIIHKENSEVLGICYEIDINDLNVLDGYERGYDRIEVQLQLDCDIFARGNVYISNSILDNIGPTDDYRSIIVKGAKSWGLDQQYIAKYLD